MKRRPFFPSDFQEKKQNWPPSAEPRVIIKKFEKKKIVHFEQDFRRKMDQVIGKRSRKSVEKASDNNMYSYKQSRTAAFVSKPVVNSVEPKLLPSVALSLYDKAPQLELSNDQLICYG